MESETISWASTVILKKKSLISYQTEERGFFLKRDPNYDQAQISMFNAAKCFNKV